MHWLSPFWTSNEFAISPNLGYFKPSSVTKVCTCSTLLNFNVAFLMRKWKRIVSASCNVFRINPQLIKKRTPTETCVDSDGMQSPPSPFILSALSTFEGGSWLWCACNGGCDSVEGSLLKALVHSCITSRCSHHWGYHPVFSGCHACRYRPAVIGFECSAVLIVKETREGQLFSLLIRTQVGSGHSLCYE